MNLKIGLLAALEAEQLKELCAELDLEADRRSRDALVAALSGAKRAKPESVGRGREPRKIAERRKLLRGQPMQHEMSSLEVTLCSSKRPQSKVDIKKNGSCRHSLLVFENAPSRFLCKAIRQNCDGRLWG